MKAIGILALLLLLSTAPALAREGFQDELLDGASIPCVGIWQNIVDWHVSDLAAFGGSLTIDHDGGNFASAALFVMGTDGRPDQIVEGHVGPGQFRQTFHASLGGMYIRVRHRLLIGGICEPGHSMTIRVTLNYVPQWLEELR